MQDHEIQRLQLEMKTEAGGGKWQQASIRLHSLQMAIAPSIPPVSRSLSLSLHIVTRKPFAQMVLVHENDLSKCVCVSASA